MKTYHNNPNQATTIGDLIQPGQLYWLKIAAESVNLDKEQVALDLFNCNLYELTRAAGEQMLQYLARVKQNGTTSEHEHDCASCGDTFTCKDTLCNSTLARYCDDCTIRELGGLCEEAGYGFTESLAS
ncbi:MAG TPA: hypothetical protein VLR90_07740 [Blastocatellia bacterium]|nr:hypothetical protein [Blastocatellia bacterium]